MTLVGYWPLDENTGSTAYDHSGYANHGSTFGTLTQGASGPLGPTAYSFDGTDDYVEVSGLQDLSTTDELTVSAWCKSPNTNWNDTGWMASRRPQFVVHPNGSSKKVNFYVNTTTAGWTSVTYAPTDITIWHHYLQTYDGSTLRAYVDGEEVGSVAINETLSSDTGVTQIGKDDTNARYGDASIGHVGIWNRALTPSEIQYLYAVSQQGHRMTATEVR